MGYSLGFAALIMGMAALVALFSAFLGSAACAWAVVLSRFPETRRAGRIIFIVGTLGACCAILFIFVESKSLLLKGMWWFFDLSVLYIGFGWASVLTARLMLARTRSHGSIDHINRTEFPPDTPEFRRFLVVSLFVYFSVWFLPIWVSGLYR